jgi:hypothetical protein
MITRLEFKDLDYHAYIECGLCGTKENLSDIKSKMEKTDQNRWFRVPFTGKYICPGCNKKITE